LEEPRKIVVMSNSTIVGADRATHVKIVAISLAASVAVLLVGMTARNTPAADTAARIQIAGPAVKVGKPVAVSHSDTIVIR
jgi:cytochrome oxidase Cu insertion factor (SCO1/SenC/PrrC family)